MTRVLAVDPGPHVGAAFWGDGGSHNAYEQTPEQFYAGADEWVRWADEVVCEDFTISGPRAREANVTIEMIGVLRYLSGVHGKKFSTQRPGAHKFGTPAKLKHLGWYTPGSDHARSATGHLLVYLVEAGHISATLLLTSTTDPEGGPDGTS